MWGKVGAYRGSYPEGRTQRGEMTMFMGEFVHSIDGKGRLIIPSKFRESLGESFVVTRGLDHCLFAYPLREWQILEEKLKQLPMTRGDARAFMRLFFSGAVDVEVDRQGRVLIPQNLREYAKLMREVVIIGVSSRVEVWSKEVWEKYSSEASGSFEELAEKLVDFDL